MIKIENETLKKLFKSDYSKTTHVEFEQLDRLAHSILENNSWDDVYENFDNFLRNDCKTEDDVINYVSFFYILFRTKI